VIKTSAGTAEAIWQRAPIPIAETEQNDERSDFWARGRNLITKFFILRVGGLGSLWSHEKEATHDNIKIPSEDSFVNPGTALFLGYGLAILLRASL